jgi:hypothetical protein
MRSFQNRVMMAIGKRVICRKEKAYSLMMLLWRLFISFRYIPVSRFQAGEARNIHHRRVSAKYLRTSSFQKIKYTGPRTPLRVYISLFKVNLNSD